MTPSINSDDRALIGQPETTSKWLSLWHRIESASRYDDANESYAKAIVSIDLIALSCLTFSVGHI